MKNVLKEKYRELNDSGMLRFIPDKAFLRMTYRLKMGKRLNLQEPELFNEKLQWLKLFDRRPEYTTMVDKYAAKQYAAKIIGEQYIIPTYGVWERFNDIDFETLPDQFVLKCTHDSGGLAVCTDKSKFDKIAARKKINKCLKHNYYWHGREWPYKNVPPRIIAEKYLSDGCHEELIDYKLMCFNGRVKAAFVCSNQFSKEGLNITVYDPQWKRMPFKRHYPASETEIKRPESYEEMIHLAELLSCNIPFLRVDFYEIMGRPYLGELTFFPGNGFEEFDPPEWDKILGDWIELDGVVGR